MFPKDPTAAENLVATAREHARSLATYHINEIEGCLDEYEDTPCNSLLARLRGAVNRAKAALAPDAKEAK